MAGTHYDAVVIGGGIHGAGVAQAVAAAGHSVLLLEKNEPAYGTSSRSSKLIHGGLRYLESGQFSLVRESLHERELLLRNAPDLVRLVPFYIPIYRQTKRRPWQIRIGLSLYSLLGGLGRNTRFRTLPQTEWPKLSGIKTDGLQAVFEYYDGQTDDAQLTHAVLRSATSQGADVIYPTRFLSAAKGDDCYQVDYQHHDQHQQCEATVLINAAGPWINLVRDGISPLPPQMEIELVQGAHLVLDRKFSDGVIYVEAPSDGRAVFIMPWKEGALVGTTETVFRGLPDDVRIQEAEVAYLEETLEHYFPGHGGSVTNSFAGLRVLPADKTSPFGRSRETTLLTERPDRPTYVGIYGGKLTAYRATAEKVVRLIRSSLPTREPRANLRTLRLK